MRIYVLYGLLVMAAVAFGWVMERGGWAAQRRSQPLLRMGYAGLAMAGITLLGHGPEPYRLFGDFTKAYYFAGQQVLQGSSDFYGQACVRGYVNIPIVAVVFAPLAQFLPPVAGWLMAAAGLGATIAAYGGLLRLTQVTGWRQWALIGLFVASGPLYYNLRLGNTTQYVLLLLVLALARGRQGRPGAMGALVAIAAVIKLPILLLGGYFLLRGRWRAAAGFGLGLVAIVGSSLLLFGPALHGSWYTQCIQPFAGKPLSAFNVQSVDSFLARLLGGSATTWVPMPLPALPFKVLRYGLLGVLVGAVLGTFRRARDWPGATAMTAGRSETLAPPSVFAQTAQELEFVTVLCLALLISPIAWTHYYLLLILPLALFLEKPAMIPALKLAGVAIAGRWPLLLSAALISLPVTLYEHPRVPEWIGNWFLSHYFLGGLLLLGVLLVARSQLAQNLAQNLAPEGASG